MIDTSWRIEDPDPDEVPVGRPSNGFVSLHFVLSTLRRRWLVWTAAALVGLLLGIAYTVLMPSKPHGTVTLLLAHDTGTDPTIAMSTDVSLLRTRTVAADTIDELHLPMTVEDFQATVTPIPVTPNVLVLDVAAPDDASAVARVSALSKAYLDFRSTQMESQATALVQGYQKRVAALKAQAATLTDQYNNLSDEGAQSQGEASDVLTQRAQVVGQISTLQQQIEDVSLESESIVTASHVIDAPSIVPQSSLKRLVLNTAAGLVGGLALGVGLVLVTGLASGRLRRRDEVALALAAPVRFSVRQPSGRAPWWRVRRRSQPERDLQVLVHGLGSALGGTKGRQSRLGLVTVDDGEDGALVVGTLGARLATCGKSVFLVDLSRAGRLQTEVARALPRERGDRDAWVEPVVFRPRRQPLLAHGPVGAAAHLETELGRGEPPRRAWDGADVVLVLAEMDLSTGVDHLTSWVDRVVVLVAGGRTSAERLRTAGELIRSAGLRLVFTMMVGVERSDESSGRSDLPDPGWSGTTRDSG